MMDCLKPKNGNLYPVLAGLSRVNGTSKVRNIQLEVQMLRIPL